MLNILNKILLFFIYLNFIRCQTLKKVNIINNTVNNSTESYNTVSQNEYILIEVGEKCNIVFGFQICKQHFNINNLFPNDDLNDETSKNNTLETTVYSIQEKNIIIDNLIQTLKNKIKEKYTITDPSQIKETVCPKDKDYNITIPLQVAITYKYTLREYTAFNYFIISDYGCKYYENSGLQPSLTLLHVPFLVGDRYQRNQYILFQRFYAPRMNKITLMSNLTLDIYNPNNILKVRKTFHSYVSGDTLYIFPWVQTLNNIFIQIEHSQNFTTIFVPPFPLNNIMILFTNINSYINNEDVFALTEIVDNVYKKNIFISK